MNERMLNNSLGRSDLELQEKTMQESVQEQETTKKPEQENTKKPVSQRTLKKVKVVGTEEYINASTGELQSFVVTTVEERDFNFTKVWMKNFLNTIGLVGNAKTKVAYWVIDNLEKSNILTYTYRQISDATGFSLDTVTKTMTILLESDFLKRINQGSYMVNPEIIFKGTHQSRLCALTQYQTVEKRSETSLEQQLSNILKSIEVLNNRAKVLTSKIEQNKNNDEEIEQNNDNNEEMAG